MSHEMNKDEEQDFYTSCKAGGKICNVLIDSKICANIVSTKMVEKLQLPIRHHPRPYDIPWFYNNKGLEVSKQALVSFAIGRYNDALWCDIIPIADCHLLLGQPWQIDRQATYDGVSNVYKLCHKGRKHHLIPLSATQVREEKLRKRKEREKERNMLCSENEIQKDLETESELNLILHDESNTTNIQVRDSELITPLEDSKDPILEDVHAESPALREIELHEDPSSRPSPSQPMIDDVKEDDKDTTVLPMEEEAQENQEPSTMSMREEHEQDPTPMASEEEEDEACNSWPSMEENSRPSRKESTVQDAHHQSALATFEKPHRQQAQQNLRANSFQEREIDAGARGPKHKANEVKISPRKREGPRRECDPIYKNVYTSNSKLDELRYQNPP